MLLKRFLQDVLSEQAMTQAQAGPISLILRDSLSHPAYPLEISRASPKSLLAGR
jgi:hypothetical protein